jgi:hypothetical protein
MYLTVMCQNLALCSSRLHPSLLDFSQNCATQISSFPLYLVLHSLEQWRYVCILSFQIEFSLCGVLYRVRIKFVVKRKHKLIYTPK